MDKRKFSEIIALIDARIETMGMERAGHMVCMFELLSASFAKEDARPSVLVHGMNDRLTVLSINVDELDTVGMLATAYSKMHDTFIGDKPEPGEIH
jgi:hypothetical protein